MGIGRLFYNKNKAIAFHEAGHIVAAYMLGCFCEKAELFKNGTAKSSISFITDPEIKCQ